MYDRLTRRMPIGLAVVAVILMSSAPSPAADDSSLARARQFVKQSDRYLHHSRLSRGMKGYGLTVMAGTEIVRFEVEIVSVIDKWGPAQDVVLAMLSGQGLEGTRVISGMSGSPVFITDPRDGKDKMIGAVAYGWPMQNEPLCGIQPITQMFALQGVLPLAGRDHGNDRGEDESTATGSAESTGRRGSRIPTGPAGAGADPGRFARWILDPRPLDFVAESVQQIARDRQRRLGGRALSLRPLTTPLMISGMRAASVGRLANELAPLGLLPVASGDAAGQAADDLKDVQLEPGSAVSIPLADGDVGWYAIGTVTEVVGPRVLAFGHSFMGEGDLHMPMATGYIHTVVSSMNTSFKLAGSGPIVGAVDRDELVAIGGKVGPKVSMIPMNVSIHWADSGRRQRFRYQACRQRFYTGLVARSLASESLLGWHALPEQHVLSHKVTVDYGQFGTFETSDIAGDIGGGRLASDLGRVILAMTGNPYAPPRYPESIDVEMTVTEGSKSADILKLALDAPLYRPGQTVTGQVTVQRFRQPRETIDIRFPLPEHLREGEYELTACDVVHALRARQQESPHLYSPKNERQLFEALQRLVDPRTDRLYLRMPLPDGGGLAIDTGELPDLPASKAGIIASAQPVDLQAFSQSLERAQPSDYAMSGAASASFEVRYHPRQTQLRSGRERGHERTSK